MLLSLNTIDCRFERNCPNGHSYVYSSDINEVRRALYAAGFKLHLSRGWLRNDGFPTGIFLVDGEWAACIA